MVRVLLSVGMVAGLFLGCNKAPETPPPLTQPAQGKLLTKSGQPVTSGMIEFASNDGAAKSARSEIKSDGTFVLEVMDAEGKKYAGAEEGTYRVTYIPQMTEAQTEVPVNLPKPVKIVAGENTLTLKLP